MATVIDRLVVELGLDPKQFTKGQKEAAASIVKTREVAQKQGAGIEKSMDGAAEAVDRLARNALKLFAIFTAGRAIKDFVTDVTSADAALGRLAKSVGSTPDVISSLSNAVARNGGSASAAAGSFERLADSINEIKTTGNSSILPFLYRLQGMGGKQINLNKELSETFGDLAENAKNIADQKGIPFATYLLKQAGVDRDTAALLVQGRQAYNKALAESRKIGIVRKEDTEAAQKLQTTMESLRQTSEGFGRTVMTALTPTINDLLERMQRWITANQDWIKTEIVEKVRQFAEWLKSIDWDAVGKGLRDFGNGALKVAEQFGGILKVCEALFLFWVGSKAIAIVSSILKIAGLLGSGPLGWAIRLAMVGAAGAAITADQMPKVLEREGAAGVDPGTGAATERAPMDSRGNEGWLRPYLRRGWNATRRFFGGGGAEAAEGGAGIRSRAARAARGDQSGGVAANPGAYKDVLDHIARSEGTANRPGGGYNTSLGYGKFLPGGKEQNLTGKTLDEILALGNSMRRQPGNPNSSALGRYQIVGSTLRDQMKKLGLKGTDLFDEKMQDRIAANLARQRGADPVGLKNEWASLVGAKNATAVALMQKIKRSANSVAPAASAAPGNRTDQQHERASIDDFLDNMQNNPEYKRKQEEAARKERDKTEGPRDGESFYDFYRRRAQPWMGTREGQKVYRKYDGSGDTGFDGAQSRTKRLGEEWKENRAPGNAYGGKSYEQHLEDGVQSRTRAPDEFTPVRGLTLDEIRRIGAEARAKREREKAAAGDRAALSPMQAGAMGAIAQTQAAQAALASNTSNDNRSTTTTETNIGAIHVQTAATDAGAIARDIGPAMKRHAFAAAANYARA